MESDRRYCTILIKRRTVGQPGPPDSLLSGELAVNEISNTVYVGSLNTQPLSGNLDPGFF